MTTPGASTRAARRTAHSSLVAGHGQIAHDGTRVRLVVELALEAVQGVPHEGGLDLVWLGMEGKVVSARQLVPGNPLGCEKAREEALVPTVVRRQLVDAPKHPRVHHSVRERTG